MQQPIVISGADPRVLYFLRLRLQGIDSIVLEKDDEAKILLGPSH